MKTLSPNLHSNEIKFIENNNKYALKKQSECLGKNDMEFKYVEKEKPSIKVKIPNSHEEVTTSLPKYRLSTTESKRMLNSM